MLTIIDCLLVFIKPKNKWIIAKENLETMDKKINCAMMIDGVMTYGCLSTSGVGYSGGYENTATGCISSF